MKYFKILKQTFDEFLEDGAPRLSAALSYYSIFSLAPLLLIAMSLAGYFLGEDAARGKLDEQLQGSLGEAGAVAVQEMIAQARKPAESIWVGIAGVTMLLIGAGGVFGQLQAALNTVWGVKQRPGRGIKGLIMDRFMSFSMVFGTGFLLLTSMLLTTALQATAKITGSLLELPTPIWTAVSNSLSFLVVTALFAAIFRVLPDVEIRWKEVRAGALFTAALFVAGKFGIGWYLGRESTASPYGSAGSLALVLIWVYYSSIILLFGAEFTQVWARHHGADLKPSRDAVALH